MNWLIKQKVRATYQREAEKAVLHLNTLGIKRIALVYLDDSFGADGVAGAQKGLIATGLAAAATEKFDHTGLDFADLSIIGTDGKFKR